LGAKVCYGILLQYHGKGGRCCPTLESVGNRLGVSSRQASSYINELVRAGYIRKTSGGKRRSNHYTFLWHASFAAQDAKDSSGQSGRILPPEENQEIDKKEDLDSLPTHRKASAASPELNVASSTVGRRLLAALVEGMVGREPSHSALGQIVAATPSKTEAEAIEAVHDAFSRGYRVGRKGGPRSMSWFVSVTQNYWADRMRRALPPAAAYTAMEPPEMDRMTAAIELPDAV
jgi:hypothetical protein